MEATIKDILDERIYCCETVQKAIELHCTASLTELKIRNIIQLELLDELKPKNPEEFYINFAREYLRCKTIEDLKLNLLSKTS
jgi:hypothetical protein